MERIKENMRLIDFINEFVCPNSIIRLWKPLKEGHGHEMIYKKDPTKPGNLDDVDMEWKFQQNKTWRCKYNNCKVIGVNDILTESIYREAINIVIDPDVHIYPDSFELPKIKKEKYTYLLTRFGGYEDIEQRKKFEIKPLQYKIVMTYLTKEELRNKIKQACEFMGMNFESMNLTITNMKDISTSNHTITESKERNTFVFSCYGPYEQPEYQEVASVKPRQFSLITTNETEEEFKTRVREAFINKSTIEEYKLANIQIKDMSTITVKDYTKEENSIF